MKLSSILLFSEDPKSLAEFYEKVLGKKVEWEDGGYYGFAVGKVYLTIGPHDKVKGKSKEPERIMLNFDVADVRAEFERIKKDADPKVIAKPYSMGEDDKFFIATFADIDGNFFQLMTPYEPELPLKN